MPRGAQARFAARVPGAGAAAGLGEFVAPAGDSETAIAALWREELAWRDCAPAPGDATAAKRAGAVQGALHEGAGTAGSRHALGRAGGSRDRDACGGGQPVTLEVGELAAQLQQSGVRLWQVKGGCASRRRAAR